MEELAAYHARKARLEQSLNRQQNVGYKLGKRTTSNLFRYVAARRSRPEKSVELAAFNHILGIDVAAQVLDVEGLATFEQIVDATLPLGLLPRVTPELKHITIGGAIAGIGIESSCFRFGFVHDMLIAAEVLLPEGRVVYCDAHNAYADLFHALPNSYGTLGYILRAKIRLTPARPFVAMQVHAFAELRALIDAMSDATQTAAVDFVEALIFNAQRSYLLVGRLVEHVPNVDDILKANVFYKLIQERETIGLQTRDYVFRYDPEWFWNLPETKLFTLFRRYGSARFRNSGFYYRYTDLLNRARNKLGCNRVAEMEPLIQDWQVPWSEALDFTRYALREVDLNGKPWLATPICSRFPATLYPIALNALYYNLGSYCHIKRSSEREPFWYSKIMDRACFQRGGIKMLYSSSFLTEEEFDRRYNGVAYAGLKRKYDPFGKLRTLYELSDAGA